MRDPQSNSRADNARPIGLALATATCTLLGLHAPTVAAQGQAEAGTWDFNAGILHYQEANGRVQATEPSVQVTHHVTEDESFNLGLVVDVLSGASPFGATPSSQVQSFTNPSGGKGSEASSYNASAARKPRNTAQTLSSPSSVPVASTPGAAGSSGGTNTATSQSYGARATQWIAPNAQPLDQSFKDNRLAVTLGWTNGLGRDWSYTLNSHYSTEHDYDSLGASGSLSRYLDNKNTTLTLGLSYSHDTVSPVGGVPLAFTSMPLAYGKSDATFLSEYSASRHGSSRNKAITGAQLGITQVINRRMLMQFNYSLTRDTGYMTDPYKILSVIDTQPGSNYGGNLVGSDGNFVYVYEKRPDSRLEQAFYWQTKFMLWDGDVADLSYRYAHNDWGMKSNTFELSYRWNWGNSYIEPDVRFYRQSKADFYHRYLTSTQYNNGAITLNAASADFRLGDMTTRTIGLKWGHHISDGQDLGLRVAYYLEQNSGPAGVGQLAGQQLYPDNKALIAELTFSF